MRFNVRHLPVVLGAVSLGLLSGCSDSKRSAQKPDPELRRVAESESAPPAAPVAPTTSTTSNGLVIRRPRPQSEIDAAYSMPVVAIPRPVEPRHVNVVPFAPVDNEALVRADPSWDVQVTRDWRHIVVHHSASVVGSASIFDKAHKERGWDGLGYHFVIGNGSASGDGEVEVGYRWKRQQAGAHAGNAEYNQAGIGICLVGDFEHGGRPSARQMASLRALVRFLQVKTGVPTSEICGHGNVPGKSTECPGKNLDLFAFRASLGGGSIGVPIQYTRESSPSSSSPVRLARTQRSSGGGL
jgi:hypothetical protein